MSDAARVERYDFINVKGEAVMRPNPQGKYVEATAYDALREERDRLEFELGTVRKLKEGVVENLNDNRAKLQQAKRERDAAVADPYYYTSEDGTKRVVLTETTYTALQTRLTAIETEYKAAAVKALNLSTSRQKLIANMEFLVDYFLRNPSANLPSHLHRRQP